MSWLKLIRWQNLLIVFATQLLAWACVILPVQHYSEQQLLLNVPNFLLLSLSTVLITAAGYIINDYFDIKIDIINKPDKVILEKTIPLRQAIIMHTVLNVIGIVMALIVASGVLATRTGSYRWIILQLFCTLLLWLYSTSLKRQFMTGNIAVALLTALTIIALILFEPALHTYIIKNPFIETSTGKIPNPVWTLAVYAYFAFMLTWMREIVKDMEDFKGDAQEGCVTMPIKWGLQKSSWFVIGLGWLTLLPLVKAVTELLFSRWWILGTYTLVALIIPILVWLVFLPRKATQQHYHTASRWLKIIMVSGIGSLIIYYFLANA